MNMLAALRLQIEWGADEALEDEPVNRMAARTAVLSPELVPTPTISDISSLQSRAAPAVLLQPVQRAQEAAAAANTLEELRQALLAFEACALATTATNLVFADGNPLSGLMIIGEGPGAEEDRAGLPFVGPAGQLLDKMLTSVGLDRTKVLLTNLIPWRPPGNRNPTDGEILTCLPFLLRHIALVQPRRLVLLGALATHAVLGSKGSITRMRGRWASANIPGLSAPIPALPMLHPTYLLRNAVSKQDTWKDLVNLRRVLDTDEE